MRVVNCSFSANTLFDYNDPVNIASKMLTDAGINVVFSAGNSGSGLNTLNPYAVAPWVVSVGATDDAAHLANFSSRGAFGSLLFHPTLVAPGVGITSLRSSTAPSIEGVLGIESGADIQKLSTGELPFYTTASGTSFSAPQVAGTIALMLEVNPNLTPPQVREILQRTATPLSSYYLHEVGAGMLNTHAAVLQAGFSSRRFGMFRAAPDHGQATFVNDSPQKFNGATQPGSSADATLNIPGNALLASVQTAWGSMSSANALAMIIYDANNVQCANVNPNIKAAGLTAKRDRAVVASPVAGAWRVHITNTLTSLSTAQNFLGALEVTRVQYPILFDVDGLSDTTRKDIFQAMRMFVMSPYSKRFYPNFAVTRGELASALTIGGRVPQYTPDASHYTDVRDATTMLTVESVQAASNGALFPDATTGGTFRPLNSVDRLTAAVALVRAAGLRAEAEAKTNAPLTVTDAVSIPANLRGYVTVALVHGFLNANNSTFLPQDALTRAELAHAMVVLSN
ncbi:MAG: hypothetical protein NVSMB56_12240 [Pyrinomonadaceae bacterium]